MRPIRLELENFTVYRGKHSLDFSPLNFFVIKGRTGAGKTSLIDAICYALYGKVPRYGKEKAHAHLISKGQRYMRVALEFSVRGRRYRIEREYQADKKRNLSDFRFYEEGRPKPFREEELNRYLKDILRLDYNIFTKVILLPQNQFDRFLKPQEPKERREILNLLLGFSEALSGLKNLVGEEYKSLVSKMQFLQSRLDQLSHISPGLILQKEKELKEVERAYKDLTEKKSQLEYQLLRCRERDVLQDEHRKTNESLKKLSDEEKEITQKKQRLEIALEILPHLPKVEQYERINLEEKRLNDEMRHKEIELKKYQEEIKTVEEEFEKVNKEFENLEVYNNKRLKISQILRSVEDYMAQKRELNRIETEIAQLEEEKRSHGERLKGLRDKHKSCFENINELRQAIQELEGMNIETEFIRAQKRKEQVERLRELEEEEKKFEKELEGLNKELMSKKEDLERAKREQEGLTSEIENTEEGIKALESFLEEEGKVLQELFSLEEKLKKAVELEEVRKNKAFYQKRLQEIEDSLRSVEKDLEESRERRFEVYAFELRVRLKEGDICPVCGQSARHMEVEETREDLKELIGKQEELEKRERDLRSQLHHIQAQISTLEGREREIEEVLNGLTKEDIQNKVSELKGIREDMSEKRQLLKQKEQNLRELRRKQTELSQSIDKLRFEEAEIREKISSKSSLVKRLEEEKAFLKNALGDNLWAVLEEVQKIEEDYEKLQSLKEREKKLIQELEEVQRDLSEEERNYTKLEERLKNLKEQKKSLEEKLNSMEEEIKESTKEPPSEVLIYRLNKYMQDLEKKIKELQEKYTKTTSYLQGLKVKEASLNSDIQNIKERLSFLQSQKESIATEIYSLLNKFGSFENIKAYALSQDQIKILQEEIEKYNKEKHNLENKLSELKKRLEGLKDLPETSLVEVELKNLNESIHENRRLYGSLQGEMEKLKRELSEKQDLEGNLRELFSSLSLYERLKNDLMDNQFPEFVSQLMLKKVTVMANYYLFKFTSGQFTFELVEGDLHIYDHAIGHHRVVSSLSGGETFLASISLAFAVADILSQNAPLESLFIDEGFGSLDRETRESFSEFFDLIRQSTDRLVGIITHVEDIAEKFDQRIEVEKRDGYTNLKVIY